MLCALMSGLPVLVVVAPLRLTVWILAVAAAAIVVLIAIGVARHLESVEALRRREHVRAELGPVFSSFLQSQHPARLGDELRPAFLRMDAAHRPVAAMLVTDIMGRASPAQREQLRDALEEAGIVDLGHRGTRRLSPWRRALACEMLGRIGALRSVPVLLERLEDRRPEVRMAAVQALGDLGSDEAVPALTEAFLARRVAPTDIVMDALRRIGGDAVTAFERGVVSTDPIVRISSCFGLSAMTEKRHACELGLAVVLDTDADPRVRAAAASALGILGGDDAPAALRRATTDPDVHVRRSAVKALGSFDDPTTGQTLDRCTEDEDRETAIRAAEALLALTRRPRAAPEARTCLDSSSAWAVEYARTVAEVSA
jgi:HEAT repeat protein